MRLQHPMYMKGTFRKDGEGLLKRTYSDRTRGNGFKWRKFMLISDIGKKILYCEGGEALEQVAQRSCACPIPGSVQGGVGWTTWSSGRWPCPWQELNDH